MVFHCCKERVLVCSVLLFCVRSRSMAGTVTLPVPHYMSNLCFCGLLSDIISCYFVIHSHKILKHSNPALTRFNIARSYVQGWPDLLPHFISMITTGVYFRWHSQWQAVILSDSMKSDELYKKHNAVLLQPRIILFFAIDDYSLSAALSPLSLPFLWDYKETYNPCTITRRLPLFLSFPLRHDLAQTFGIQHKENALYNEAKLNELNTHTELGTEMWGPCNFSFSPWGCFVWYWDMTSLKASRDLTVYWECNGPFSVDHTLYSAIYMKYAEHRKIPGDTQCSSLNNSRLTCNSRGLVYTTIPHLYRLIWLSGKLAKSIQALWYIYIYILALN